MYAFKAHEQEIVDIDYSPNGQWIVSASNDRTAIVWRAGDISRGTVRAAGTLSDLPPRMTVCKAMDGLTSVRFSPNSRFIATGSLDNSVNVWDVFTGSCIATCNGVDEDIGISCSVTFGPNFELYSSRGRTIKKWQLFDHSGNIVEPESPPQCILTMTGHEICFCRVSSNRDWVCAVSGDRTCTVWDAESGEAHFTLDAHNDTGESSIVDPENCPANDTSIYSDGYLHTNGLSRWRRHEEFPRNCQFR